MDLNVAKSGGRFLEKSAFSVVSNQVTKTQSQKDLVPVRSRLSIFARFQLESTIDGTFLRLNTFLLQLLIFPT
jgi:hypothetical protein